MPTYNYMQRRSSLRLSSHDYSSAGFYFVTIITRGRENFLGEIINHKMILSDIGKIIYEQWLNLPEHFSDIELDEFIIMPNHIHGIIVKKYLSREEINSMNFKNQSLENTKQHLSKIIRFYKSSCTRIINSTQNKIYFGWHKNYYDEVIRDNYSLNNIRKYIQLNPSRWEEDKYNIHEKV